MKTLIVAAITAASLVTVPAANATTTYTLRVGYDISPGLHKYQVIYPDT